MIFLWEMSQNSKENSCDWVLFIRKDAGLSQQLCQQKSPSMVSFLKFVNVFRNSYFSKHIYLKNILFLLNVTDSFSSSSKGIFRAMSKILDGVFCGINERLKAVHYFRETLHLKRLTEF